MNKASTNLHIIYFAKLGDDLDCSNETIRLPASSSLQTLKDLLSSRGSKWQGINEASIRCAINQSIVKNNPELNDGDEIAFFPPVSGG